MEPNSSSRQFPKFYYSRKGLYWLARLSSVVAIIMVITQSYFLFFSKSEIKGSPNALVTGLLVLMMTRGYSKPRIVLTTEDVTLAYNAFRSPRIIKLSDIQRAENAERFQFIMKDNSQIVLPKLEFNKKTRETVLSDIHSLLHQEK